MIHILVGEQAAEKLMMAFDYDENLKGEVLILKDSLDIGPLQVQSGESFSEMRTHFWNTLQPNAEHKIQDHEAVLAIIEKAQREEEPLCFWMAPCAPDVMAYYWLLSYVRPYPQLLHIISINGLPFFNEKGAIFYPNHFGQIPPTEFTKTKRLLKEVSPADYETDGDEWMRLTQENAQLRIHDGGKKIISTEQDYFDAIILNHISGEFQKASKVLADSMKKITQIISPYYLEWRLRSMAELGRIAIQGDVTKSPKDFEVKKEIIQKSIEDQVQSE